MATMFGTAGADSLHGETEDDFISAGPEGAESLDAGDDRLTGGAGYDTLLGWAGSDTLSGEGGSDELSGGSGNDLLLGGHGTDLLRGSARSGSGIFSEGSDPGDDTLLGGGGADYLISFGGADSLDGGAGDDDQAIIARTHDPAGLLFSAVVTRNGTILAGGGTTVVNTEYLRFAAGSGNDTVEALVIGATVAGGDGDDVLTGAFALTSLLGGGGDDTLQATYGVSELLGEEGNDSLVGSSIASSATLDGGSGDDVLRADGASTVFVVDSLGDVLIIPEISDGETLMSAGNLDLRDWDDRLDAAGLLGFAEATLHGSKRGDRLHGNGVDNVIRGAQGNDTLTGLGGNDTLIGGAGADFYRGGTGRDVLVTRPDGATDIFFFDSPEFRTFDVVKGFVAGEDKVELFLNALQLFPGELVLDATGLVIGPGAAPVAEVATLLLDTETGMLSLDRDGTGFLSARVLARFVNGLPDASDFVLS